ncbi:MAG: prenyltransferase/squalene oxidase repeat-containing protein [Planctomycetota bacterium]
MGEPDPNPDSLTLEGVGGLFNGEVFVLVPGQSGTIGRSSIATFPVTVCRNYRRLDGDPSRDGLLEAMHPEHVRFLYVGGGRLIVENLAGRDVDVGHHAVPDRLDVDLAKGGVEVRFGYGERILATFPGSAAELQELAPRRDPLAAAEGVFMALLRPDGTLAVGDVEEEYSLAPTGEESGPTADPESDTGEIPEISDAEIAAAREKARPKRRRRFFGLRPSVFFSVLFHLVVVLGLFSTIHIMERHGAGENRVATVAMEAPTPPSDTPKPTPRSDEEVEQKTTDVEPTPVVDDSRSETFTDDAGESPAEGPGRDGDGPDGMVGIGAGGLSDQGSIGAPAPNSGDAGGKKYAPLSRALAWLATHQRKDGAWGGISSIEGCGKCTAPAQREYEVAMTGLAILAFTGGGSSHRKGPHARRVMRAVRWLVKRQQKDGSFHGSNTAREDREIYGEAIAAYALAELCRIDGTPLLRAALARALRHLERAQAPYAGWRYQPGEAESDTSVTAWAMLAFSTAERAKVAVNPMVEVGARAWLGTVTDPKTLRIGYRHRGRGSLGMNAAGLSMMLAMDRTRFSQPIRAAGQLLKANPPVWPEPGEAAPPGNPPDMNYWFFGTMAARRAGGDFRRNWTRTIRRLLVKNQESGGHERGSFTPCGRWSRAGGRVYATATAALCLY